MLTDAVLAIVHHLLAFALAIVLTMEIMLTRPGIAGGRLTYLSRIDMAFGGIAAAILLIGIGRVIYGLRGSEYYIANHFFWAKMAAFAAVGIISIWPTMAILRWRTAARAQPDFQPAREDVMTIRRFMHSEALVFTLIPIFAALMARYGT